MSAPAVAKRSLDQGAAQERRQRDAQLVARRFRELTGLKFDDLRFTSEETCTEFADELLRPPASFLYRLHSADCPVVRVYDDAVVWYGVRLSEGDAAVAGFGVLPGTPPPPQVVITASEAEWSRDRLNDWWSAHRQLDPQLAERLLSLAVESSGQQRSLNELETEVDELTERVFVGLEQISALHALAGSLQIDRSTDDLVQLCLDRVHECMQAEGTAIWLQSAAGIPLYETIGEFGFDETELADLLERHSDHDWRRPLIDNHLARNAEDAKGFANLRNFAAARIGGQEASAGWLVTRNTIDGREFGSVEGSLLNSVAQMLATHLQNTELFRRCEDLLLSFVRSMVSSLDAKDPYTRGHSERVALIARRLGEEMGLPEDELESIYLSGLLHDIGKIGVDDAILRKPTKLTDEEFRHIQRHPLIGYQILAGLSDLKHILPGVRSHHEAWNGNGYPDKLTGQEIPLMARILAVADSYDAMSSDRPYRLGMPLSVIEERLRDGSGTSWDPEIIECYFRARSDIRRICELHAIGGPGHSMPTPSIVR